MPEYGQVEELVAAFKVNPFKPFMHLTSLLVQQCSEKVTVKRDDLTLLLQTFDCYNFLGNIYLSKASTINAQTINESRKNHRSFLQL